MTSVKCSKCSWCFLKAPDFRPETGQIRNLRCGYDQRGFYCHLFERKAVADDTYLSSDEESGILRRWNMLLNRRCWNRFSSNSCYRDPELHKTNIYKYIQIYTNIYKEKQIIRDDKSRMVKSCEIMWNIYCIVLYPWSYMLEDLEAYVAVMVWIYWILNKWRHDDHDAPRPLLLRPGHDKGSGDFWLAFNKFVHDPAADPAGSVLTDFSIW